MTIIPALLVAACASSHGVQVAGGSAMRESAIVATRSFISRDEPALRMFGARDPLAMMVADAVVPLNLPSIADIPGLVEALYPERSDPDYLRDSLDKVESSLPPEKLTTELHLSRLSTSSDGRATLMYVRLDSTLRTGYYAVMAFLLKDRLTDEEDPAATVGYDKMIAYLLVYNPQAELILVRREERP